MKFFSGKSCKKKIGWGKKKKKKLSEGQILFWGEDKKNVVGGLFFLYFFREGG